VSSVREIGSLLFGRLCHDWAFSVVTTVTSYFDDSGTDSASPLILYGGLFGFEHQWLGFERAWKDQLDHPTGNKPPISRLHMYDLEHGLEEFAGYNQADKDNTIFNFRKIITDSGLHGYVNAIEKAAYDELIVGGLRSIWGDSEEHCVTQCILRLGLLVGEIDKGAELAFVFDNRQDRNEANKKAFEVFQRHREYATPELPIFSKILFDGSMKTTPLQGADLVAYEYFRHVRNILSLKKADPPVRARQHWQRLHETGRFFGEMALRPQLTAMAASIKVDPAQGALIGALLGLSR
jgi:hypothetical protein